MSGKKVGYGSPPDYTKWAKGQSGNPKGRPKGSTNLKTDLLLELSEIVQVNEGGRVKRLTKQRALVKTLMARSLKADARSANIMLSLMTRLLTEQAEAPTADAPITAEDQVIIDSFLASLKPDGDTK